MIDVDGKKSENIQTMVTRADRQRIELLAEQERRSISDMVRVLVLESLYRWEKSNPGRKRRLNGNLRS